MSDPNATLAFIEDLYAEDPMDDTLEYALDDLAEWIEKGGFAPNWERFPVATDLFNRYVSGY